MTVTTEILYQNKTQHEDVEEFKENIAICSNCADKLLSNNDVARSAFNKFVLTLEKVPGFLLWTMCRQSAVHPLNRDWTCQSTRMTARDSDHVGGCG